MNRSIKSLFVAGIFFPVAAADYVVWRKTDGTQAGYDAWRTNFGKTLPAGSGAALPSAASLPAAVPEPGSLLLVTMAAAGLLRRRRAAT